MKRAGGLLVLLVLLSGSASCFVLWRWKHPPSKDYIEAPIEYYLLYAKTGRFRSAWLEDDLLKAELKDPWEQDGRRFRWVHVRVPSGIVRDPARRAELRSVMPQGRFHP